MFFSVSARFDEGHQLTFIMDPDTNAIEVIWYDSENNAKTGTVVWDEDDGGGD